MSNLVTFEQAKMLKELGFNEVVNTGYVGYTKRGNLVSRYEYSRDREYQKIPCWIKCPSVSDAIDWLREEKGIACGVIPQYENYEYVCVLYNNMEFSEEFKSHPLANSALLTAVLNYLIEKEK